MDTIRKLLEEMILQRLQGHMVGENGLSENQFGFRKGRSTVDVIQAVVDIATKARRGTGKRKRFCALISNITYAMRSIPRGGTSASRHKHDRWVIYEGDK